MSDNPHGENGAIDIRYVLLSLMTPSFPLPSSWAHVDYRDLAAALAEIDADALGRIRQSQGTGYHGG